MANAIYPLYKEAVLTGSADVSLTQDTVQDGPYCALVDTGTYTYSALHQFFSHLTGVIGTAQRIASPTVNGGTFDGANVTFTAVSGAAAEALVIYRHNAGASWRLVAYIDSGIAGLPVVPNGGDITIAWDPAGIFSL